MRHEISVRTTQVPVNIVTGFLGSGKTTLLRKGLDQPVLSRAAVLINEIGEVGLDHILLERLEGEIVLLQNGCICCTIREDLAEALKGLADRRSEGTIPSFDRVVVETTGLADPVPLIATLMHAPAIRNHFRPASIISTVDAINAPAHIRNLEAARQIAVADRVIITKTDMADPATVHAAKTLVTRINATAPLLTVLEADRDWPAMFATDLLDHGELEREAQRWFEADLAHRCGHRSDQHEEGPREHASRHNDVRTVLVDYEEPVDWSVTGLWLSALLHRHGDRILRTKGILNVAGSDSPVVVHGVQHLVHAPVHLSRWPTEDRQSRLIFIVRGLQAETLKSSLSEFLRVLGAPSEDIK